MQRYRRRSPCRLSPPTALTTNLIAMVLVAAVAALPCFVALAWAENRPQHERYDTLFRSGVLDALAPGTTIRYRQAGYVPAAAAPQSQAAAKPHQVEGTLVLQIEPAETVRLTYFEGQHHRSIGSFPQSVGNPLIMYFLETVVRNMAQSAGGSPYYIRNRIKEALVAPPAKTEQVRFGSPEVAAEQITLQPFVEDENRLKMGAFADLTLTFTVSDQVPGWYGLLRAEVPSTGNTQAYHEELRNLGTETTQ